MSPGLELSSASGLRPTSAFLLVALVLAVVGARAAQIAVARAGEQPANVVELPAPPVLADVVDASGIPLATSIDTLELVLSPNALWQAHTPERIAEQLAPILGPEWPVERLLVELFPDARQGWITTAREPLLLSLAEARAVAGWIARGGSDPAAELRAIPGMVCVATGRPDEYAIAWCPVRVLCEATRSAHGHRRTIDWTRHLSDGLLRCLLGAGFDELARDPEALQRERDRVWAALQPSVYQSLVREVSPAAALDLHAALGEERVQSHQMRLVRGTKRVYPAQAGQPSDPPLAVLGRWGLLDPAGARRRARAELGLPEDELCRPEDLERLDELARAIVHRASPMGGIELLAERALAEEPFRSAFERRPEAYRYRSVQAVHRSLCKGYLDLVPGTPPPRVVTSLDLGLQREMRRQLELVLREHDPVLAEAIAVEVATGRVLAVDAVESYRMAGFLPTLHTFTPGSTMKVLTMATALDAGCVRPETTFATHGGRLQLPGRTITEAEGTRALELSRMSASEGLAHSVNAVLVQIGLSVPAETLRGRLVALGYGEYPGTGMGSERRGALPRTPWRASWEHASVSFGYELRVTLWQHAAALATVLRGGERRPLTLVDAVEDGATRIELPRAAPQRIFAEHACNAVRAMMKLGAEEGTGQRVRCPDIEMGTKTGTAERTATELCLHVETEHAEQHAGCTGRAGCRGLLAGRRAHKGRCYTSSMCVFGRLPGGGREVMVLVVVEEPRRGKKFGADVAGPAAVALLEEALGHTREGVRPTLPCEEGFVTLEVAEPDASARPWLEVQGARR